MTGAAVLVGLKLDYKLNFFTHEGLRVSAGCLLTVAVVQNHQIDVGLLRGGDDALRDGARKGEFPGLTRVPDPQPGAVRRVNVQLILFVGYAQNKSPLLQGEQNPESGRDAQSRACGNLGQAKPDAGFDEGFDYVTRAQDSLTEISIRLRLGHIRFERKKKPHHQDGLAIGRLLTYRRRYITRASAALFYAVKSRASLLPPAPKPGTEEKRTWRASGNRTHAAFTCQGRWQRRLIRGRKATFRRAAL
jgi:hypothetical protein